MKKSLLSEQKNQSHGISFENGQMKTYREKRDYEKWTMPASKTQNYSLEKSEKDNFCSPKSKETKNFFNKYAKMTSSYCPSGQKN